MVGLAAARGSTGGGGTFIFIPMTPGGGIAGTTGGGARPLTPTPTPNTLVLSGVFIISS